MILPVSPRFVRWLLPACALFPVALPAAPLISEIMYHPAGVPEDVTLEWVEIYNPDAVSVDAGGWQLTKGVNFTIPPGTTIAAGGYLVVAADVTAFQTAHPGFAGSVVGGWTGRLSNSGEQIQLEDATGAKVNDVTYSSEGDWAIRARGALSLSHRGWDWANAANGEGRSAELQNPALGNGTGQNWTASAVDGGTPGAANSAASADVAPLIKGAHHSPDIPHSTGSVTVSCTLEDEGPGAVATLHWRLDGAASFQAAVMADGDGDGDVEALIPAQADQAIVEWYVSATDGTNTRTWPPAARTSNPGAATETYGQAVNALYQVDNSYDATAEFRTPGSQPIYRMVLTGADRAELTQLQTTNGQEDSEASFPCAFFSHDGTGVKTRIQASVRNRGQGSALGPPNNYHVAFALDAKWNGRKSIALNCQYGYSQMLGQAAMATAGLATQDAAIVRVRVNGNDLAQAGNRMFGRYVRLEGRDADWVQAHYPADPDGNFYRLDDHNPAPVNTPPGNLGSGEFRYEGADPAAYADTFFKETNKEQNDFSDLADFAKIVSAPATGGSTAQPAISDADYPAAVATVLDLENFYRFMAADALIGNQEGGLQSGRADDASLYRGVLDTRFRFIPHDLDDVFDIGDGVGNPITRSLFSYDTSASGVEGLTRLYNHPQLLPRYYSAVLAAMDDWFNHATLDPLIDQIMLGWVPASDGSSAAPNRGISQIKAYIDDRRANILSQIQQNYTVAVTGAGTTTSPEGYAVTATGAVTIGGTFNVAKTYSITVNGQAAQVFYRDAGADNAGTWKIVVPAGGGSVLRPGLNKVVVAFCDGINGTGNVIRNLTADVVYNAVGTGTVISGALSSPGSLSMIAPDSYVPGVPVLVRVDLKDTEGNLNRSAWNTTVNLTATNGVLLTPSTVTLTNGMGSALVSFGGTGGGTQTIFSYGTGGTGTAGSGTPGSVWKTLTDLTPATIGSVPGSWKDEGFDDSDWVSRATQTGYGDNDENTPFPRVDYGTAAGTQSGPSYLFRNTFTIADLPQIATVTGEVKFDDTCAVYVNGQEIYRHSDLSANAPLTEYSETTTGTTRENATANLTVPLSLLHAGVNTIAVEVHQHDAASSDVTFDLRLAASLTSANPGDFSLTAAVSGLSTTKALTSLDGAPETTASGTLPAGTTTWSGIVRITGDVTVPVGATLNVAAGAHILLTGSGTAGDSAGTDVIVSGGTLAVNGTAAQPVSFSAADPATRWGQIYLNGAQPTVCSHLLLSHAGHAPGQGHTGRGPVFRLNGADLTLNDCAVGDSPGKALYSAGTCDFVMNRSLMARMITGPETENGSSLILTDSNIQDILPHYRESNDAVPDDEDALYVHNSSGRPVLIERCVLSLCGDDLIDCLAGPLTVRDTILRQGWDKGVSLLNNDLDISGTLIVDCDKAIVPKSDSATTRTINVDRCTIYSLNHDTTLAPWGYSIPPTAPDADSPSTGLYTQNKAGQSNAGATLAITAKNCIILAESPVLIDAPYTAANTVVNYSITRDTDTPATAAWAGTGNSNADPLFANLAADDFHLAAGSPAINTGNPADTDPDGSRADMGSLPAGVTGGGGGAGEIRWNLAGSPYHVTANTTVPVDTTLRIDPGVSVRFDQNVRLTVNGRILAEGAPGARIVFSHVPGTVLTSDVDPIKNGTQTGAPKWGGIRIFDSMDEENVFRYCDFINAQGTSTSAPENYGSVGFIRSRGWVDNCTWAGTHLRMCYGRNSTLTVTHNVFPDMFIFDPVLNRIENTTDFVGSADNNQEPLKVEYPTTDAEVSGNAAYPNGQPYGGHWRVYYNDFNGNRGHNDVFDADSGRWGQPGQFLLDCRYNWFHGISGDEHIDLGGDAYIASNIFERASKDQWTSDTGYSNAISSGDKGSGTTIMVARNICYDLDHVINCKLSTATIFEHNTVARLVPDFLYTFGFTQNVKCAPVNFFIPEDGTSPSYGDGAYMGYNLISNVPRLFSGADARKTGGNVVNDVTTKIEFNHNLLSDIGDQEVGPNHPGGIFGGTYGPNEAGAPGFVDEPANDFSLRIDSPARGNAPFGLNYGADIPEWAYALGGPVGTVTADSAQFVIGGPGIVAFKWRINGGDWSAPVQIGTGGVLPRGATATVRQETLALTGLTAGVQTLEVLGQDMAGNWQDADPARTIDGLPQAAPTVRTWTVDPAFQAVRLSEIVANGADSIELFNAGATPADVTGWVLADTADAAGGYTIPAGTVIPAGGYLTFTTAATGLGLDLDGDAVYLFDASVVLQDSVVFGTQAPGYNLVRDAGTGVWSLGLPTPDAANAPVQLGDPRDVRISEWFVSGSVLYKDDWIELANTSPLPVSLATVTLTDNPVVGAPVHVFAPLSFLAPGGFGVYFADGRPQDGAAHLGFSLDVQQDEIILASAGAIIDRVTFGPATTDWSATRDANGITVFRQVPTRGFDLAITDPAWLNAQAILEGLRITEIMYNPVGGTDFEFIELTNAGSAAIDLTGVRFTQGIDFTFGALTLLPGQQTLLVANAAAFESRYGAGLPVAGVYSGKLDNAGETLVLKLPLPFDGNVLCFSWQDSWFAPTDGQGYSLELLVPATAPDRFDNRTSWSASAAQYGSPAGTTVPEPTVFAQWTGFYGLPGGAGLDTDGDGVDALTEFALGTSPVSAKASDGTDALPVAVFPDLAGQIFPGLQFSLAESSLPAGFGRDGLRYVVQDSDELGDWRDIATKSPADNAWQTSTVPAAQITVSGPVAGRYQFSITTPDGTGLKLRKFVRMKFELIP